MKNNCCGVFESMRCYKGHIVYFDEHLKRLKRSCGLLSIRFPYRLGNLKNMIAADVEASGLKDAYIRLVLSKSGDKAKMSLVIKKYLPFTPKKYNLGFKADIARLKQNNPSFAQIKTTDRRTYEASFKRAKKNNLDEAIILNRQGNVCEGTRSNIFLVKAGQLVTPRLECGCLRGITREVVFDMALKCNIKISKSNFTVKEILTTEEAFLTNSLMGVMPLVSVCGKPISKGKAGKLTKLFIKKYRFMLKNGSKEDKITI